MRRLFVPVSMEQERLLFAPAPKPIILLIPLLVLLGLASLWLMPAPVREALLPFAVPMGVAALLLPSLARLGAKKLLLTPRGAFWQGAGAEAPMQPPRRVVYRERNGFPFVEWRFAKGPSWILLLKGVEDPLGVASQVAAYVGRQLDTPQAKI